MITHSNSTAKSKGLRKISAFLYYYSYNFLLIVLFTVRLRAQIRQNVTQYYLPEIFNKSNN